jgi:hypothetical protein
MAPSYVAALVNLALKEPSGNLSETISVHSFCSLLTQLFRLAFLPPGKPGHQTKEFSSARINQSLTKSG